MQNTNNPESGEIDLFELFSCLWQNKLTIIVMICLGIALSAVYAFTAKEQWTSRAQIIQPNAVQLGGLLEVQQGYSRLASSGGLSMGSSPEAMQKNSLRFMGSGNNVGVDEFQKNVFNTMVVMLNAPDNKRDYLLGSAYFRQQAMSKNDELAQQKMLVEMSQDMQVNETEKNKRDSFDIGFVAETASDAQKTLQGYMESINTLVFKKQLEDLRLQINDYIRSLENEVGNIKQQAEQEKNNQLMLLRQAIQVAKDANIAEYTGESTVAGNTIIDFSNPGNMFLLGEKYLVAQLRSLEASPIIYPVSYYQVLSDISGLKSLLDVEPKGMAFQYTLAPTQPLIKDKPQKSLILILGALLGGVFGCGIVLLQSAIKNRKIAA